MWVLVIIAPNANLISTITGYSTEQGLFGTCQRGNRKATSSEIWHRVDLSLHQGGVSLLESN